ncbi:sensor histidine kinase [Puniceibacterium sediminis]|uniref:histidine kinase n=1 Tax=Puniceibacterium sediminis TaxID=1608407 RepID=A0A238V328_9RHOB|nr:sensor histidine kinase [Puniceibacterium sediminis]SNR27929.1 Two-component sensor histidine kinase, contains HisKA and HATPase domains [Puniceibacterium sediminis]
MIGAAGPRPLPGGLAARIIGFLSIALIPLGVVAYLQTAELSQETRARSQLSLTALTESAASGERQTILRALGAAQALGSAALLYQGDDEECSAIFKEYVETRPNVSFAGILSHEGILRCSSAGETVDISTSPNYRYIMDNPRSTVQLNDTPRISKQAVLMVAEPFMRDGAVAGYVSISIPAIGLRDREFPDPDSDIDELLTFNTTGQVLSSRSPREHTMQLLPDALDLATLSGSTARSFKARSADGKTRIFAVAPLVPGLVYALSIWPENGSAASAVQVNDFAKILPFLMWAASVIVAFLAINRLVIRHVRTLSQQMRNFARNRRLPQETVGAQMALELRDMESDFLHMADAIMQDEAQLENALREKTILLKEVHHRVKNNLQLISSIMNMQIRQSQSEETQIVLRRLQDRIRGLATIHRNLYQTEDLGHVDAGRLLDDLIQQMSLVADETPLRIKLDTELENIELYPDQAVPLSLLTAEALTNAVKYIHPDETGMPRVSVSFKRIDKTRAAIEISNSCDADTVDPTHSNGLGSRLIRAFATQLGGELEQGPKDSIYLVRVEFTLTDFIPEARDY